MANKYWRGPPTGGNMNDGANWSLTQGGAATTAPTASDILYIDATSPQGYFQSGIIYTGFVCNSLIITEWFWPITLNITNGATWNANVNMTLPSGTTFTGTGWTYARSSTGTLISGGATFVAINQTAGSCTLGDSLTVSGTFRLIGSLFLNDYNLTVYNLEVTSTSSKTINFATYSVIYCTGPQAVWYSTGTLLTTTAAYTSHPKTVYWNNMNMNWQGGAFTYASALSWVLTGNGGGIYSNVKNIEITNNYSGSQNFSGMYITGDLTLGTNLSLTYTSLTANLFFYGGDPTYMQRYRYLRFNGRTIPCTTIAAGGIWFNTATSAPYNYTSTDTCTWVLRDAVNFGTTANVTLQNGSIDLGGYNFTCGSFIIGGQGNALWYNYQDPGLPGGTIVCGAATPYAFAINTSASSSDPGYGTGYGPIGGYATGKISLTSSSAKSFIPNSNRIMDGIISQDGAGALTVANTGCSFGGLACTYTGGSCNIIFQTGGSTSFQSGNTNWAVNGSGAGRVILQTNAAILRANTTMRHTITKPDGGFCNYLEARDINFYPQQDQYTTPFVWNIGLNSIANNCTGAVCISSQQVLYQITYTSASYFTTPADWNPSNNYIAVYGAGGGGSGCVRSAQYYATAAGGGGGFAGFANYPAPAGVSIPLSIGLGGSAGSPISAQGAQSSSGTDGGSSTFGNSTYGGVLTATGGTRGQASASNTAGSQFRTATGGAGGSGSGPVGTVSYTGGTGGSLALGPQGATSYFLFGGGGGGCAGRLGNGGNGGAGSSYTVSTSNYAAGGGGSSGGSAGVNAAIPGPASPATYMANNYYGFGGGGANTTISYSANSWGGGGGIVRGSTAYYPLGGVDMYYGAGAGGGWGGTIATASYINTTLVLEGNSMHFTIGGGGGSGGASGAGAGLGGSHGGIVILYTRYVPVVGGGGFLDFF